MWKRHHRMSSWRQQVQCIKKVVSALKVPVDGLKSVQYKNNLKFIKVVSSIFSNFKTFKPENVLIHVYKVIIMMSKICVCSPILPIIHIYCDIFFKILFI